jgi:hypothetical protein
MWWVLLQLFREFDIPSWSKARKATSCKDSASLISWAEFALIGNNVKENNGTADSIDQPGYSRTERPDHLFASMSKFVAHGKMSKTLDPLLDHLVCAFSKCVWDYRKIRNLASDRSKSKTTYQRIITCEVPTFGTSDAAMMAHQTWARPILLTPSATEICRWEPNKPRPTWSAKTQPSLLDGISHPSQAQNSPQNHTPKEKGQQRPQGA